MTHEQSDAFDAFYTNWRRQNPQNDQYLPFDLQDFFIAGLEFAKESCWHTADETPSLGKTILAHEPESGRTELSYCGGQIDRGFWAYAEEVFSEEMLMTIHEREAELAAWFAEEDKKREARINLSV